MYNLVTIKHRGQLFDLTAEEIEHFKKLSNERRKALFLGEVLVEE